MASVAPHEPPRLVLMYVLMFTLLAGLAGLGAGAYVVFGRALPLYKELKAGSRGMQGQVHRPDDELGYTSILSASGAQIMEFGVKLPMRYDQNGFRIPVAGVPDLPVGEGTHPIILTLGCSYTYGAAMLAQDTYPFLVGSALGGTVRNAGYSSYGLSQMLILARRLIPLIKPDFVVVQYSPWLYDRSVNPMIGLIFGKAGQPYFHSGTAELHATPFAGKIFELPVDRYRNGPTGVLDFGRFLFDVAFPLALNDGFNLVVYRAQRLLGLLPPPTSDRAMVERAVYGEIAGLAKAEGAEPIMVTIGVGAEPVPVLDDVAAKFLFVDANATLLAGLNPPDRTAWIRAYSHWLGDPPRPVDYHPNAIAHRIIADEILAAMRQSGFVDPPSKSQ